MSLNYGDIIYSVANNVGYDIPTSAQIEIIKRHLYLEMKSVLRTSRSIKEEFEKPITPTKTTMEMPDNFYLAEEVMFLNENKHKLYSAEMEHEDFVKWDPSAFDTEILSFEELALLTSGSPTRYYSYEDLQYANVIGYCFVDQKDRPKMRWNPGVTGYLKVVYSATLDNHDMLLNSNPEILHVFEDVIINGCSYRVLNLRMVNAETEIQLVAIRNSMSVYKSQRDEGMRELIAYTNHNTETPYVRPFNLFGTEEDIYHG